MSIKSKIVLVVVGFFLPIALLTYFFISARMEKIRFAEKELIGSVYLRPLFSALQSVSHLRVNVQTGKSTDSELSALKKAVEELRVIEKKYHDDVPLDDKLITLDRAMTKLSGGTLSLTDATQVAVEIRGLIAAVGDKSNLILDPDLDSFYVMDAVLLKLPEVLDVMSQATALAGDIVKRQALTNADRTQSVVLGGGLATNLNGAVSDIDIAQKNNPLGNVKGKLNDVLIGLLPATTSFTNALAGIDKADSEALMSAQTLTTTYDASANTVIRHWNSAIEEMDVLLKERADSTRSEMYISLVVVVVVLLITIVFTIGIVRTIITSLNNLITVADTAAKGNLNVRPDTSGKDEITQVAISLNVMIERIRTMIAELDTREYLEHSTNIMLQSMDDFSNGDLTVRLHSESNDAIGKLFRGFTEAVLGLESMVTDILRSIQATSQSTRNMTGAMERMAAGAEEQSVQVDSISLSLRDMLNNIHENASATNSAAQSAESAGTIARNGGKVIDATVHSIERIADIVQRSAKTVAELGDRSSEIGEIVSVINEIADQTNLLALNAAIEAARAGDQGRGFAVVADEVRKLAERTSLATKQIAKMINHIQTSTQGAVTTIQSGLDDVVRGQQLATEAGVSLREMIRSSEETASAIAKVASFTDQQLVSAEHLTTNMEQVAIVTREFAEASQEVATQTERINAITAQMESTIGRFTISSGQSATSHSMLQRQHSAVRSLR